VKDVNTITIPRQWIGLVVLAALAATAVWLGTRDSGASANNPTSPSTAARTDAITHLAPTVAPEGGVILPEGSDQIDGLPVKFPYSDLGAIALQVAVTKAQIGFEVTQALALTDIYVADEARGHFADRIRASVALRRQQAGVPETGEPPAPASYAMSPIAYQLEELGPDYYAVSMLSYVTFTTVTGQTRDGYYTGIQFVKWTKGDWKVVQGAPSDLERLSTQSLPASVGPEDPRFLADGWIPLSAESP